MQTQTKTNKASPWVWLGANGLRILVSVAVPVITFIIMRWGFMFLRDSEAPKLVIALVAIVWGRGRRSYPLHPDELGG